MVPNIYDLDALSELAAQLESASKGDRRLDLKIEYCVGVAFQEREDLAKLLIDEGFSWDTVSEALEDGIPLYTASLDAALPGENIVFTVRSERRGRWGAVHRSADGRDHLVWAATESLARRLAILSALVKANAEDQLSGEDRRAGIEIEEENRDWKVMF